MIQIFDGSQIDLLLSVNDEYITKEVESFKRYSSKDTVNIELNRVSIETLDTLLKVLKDDGKNSSNSYNVTKVAIDIIKNPSTAKVSKLSNLPDALNSIFDSLSNRMLFKADKDGSVNAYTVLRATFHPATSKDTSSYVSVSFKYYSKGSNTNTSITYYSTDIRSGASAVNLLMDKGFILETPELIEAYNEDKEFWGSILKNHGQQYLIKSYSALDSWGRHERLETSADIKAVNNFGEFSKIESVSSLTIGGKDIEQAIHFYVPTFVLDKHTNVWASTSGLKIYKYNPDIKSKLILHPDHEDLIDALADTYTVEMDDIIENKSGGTVVLATGTAGVGKTTTAEVLSEVIKRPLYKINVSSLGTDPIKIEESLEKAFQRANSWEAILLLDEADLYIMERDNNIQHNAIVTVFLKGLEYSKGLTFLTTNKGKNVDDAILSRCTAIIHYELPEGVSRQKLWTILSSQFDLNISDDLISKLVETYPNVSGRDIKMLCILVYKYTKSKNIEPTFEVFKKLSVFRNMEKL